jgi:hypothetical protein
MRVTAASHQVALTIDHAHDTQRYPANRSWAYEVAKSDPLITTATYTGVEPIVSFNTMMQPRIPH